MRWSGRVCQADQAVGEFGELFRLGCAFAFFGAHLYARDQTAEILVAFAAFGQQRIAVAIGAGDFGADVRADAGFFCGHVKTRRAGNVVAIEDRQGGEVEFGGARDEFFGNGGAFQKAERRAGVEFDIRCASHTRLR